MGQFYVEQRTKDAMFNATSLIKQYNEANGTKKEIKDYLENKSTQEFLNALKKEENLNGENSPYLTSRGKYSGGTWMHPIMFIDFAMWLNPTFKVKVIKFVYDQMIQYRNEAGDAYKELSSSVQSIVSKSFMPIAMQKVGEAINWVVFNNHEKMIRNKKGEEAALRELYELERKVAANINDGFICSFESLITYLRRKYSEKYYPKVFLTK
jgi:hypothetical protein